MEQDHRARYRRFLPTRSRRIKSVVRSLRTKEHASVLQPKREGGSCRRLRVRNDVRDGYVLDTVKEREERGPKKDTSRLSNWKRVYMEAVIESEEVNRVDV